MDEYEQLDELRKRIDQLDRQIIELLAQRLQLVQEAGKYKQAHKLPALDEARWQQATEARLKLAQELRLPQKFMAELYELIHDYTLQIEKDLGAK
jgi:chorismate mutase